MSRKVTTKLDEKHRKDLEEFIETCCYEFLYNVKKERYDVAEQWLINVRAGVNTLTSGYQTIITN